MSVQSAPFYWLVCDSAGCDEKSTSDSDYIAWGDRNDAIEDAQNAGWMVTESGAHYCDAHRSEGWAPADHHDAADLISVEPS